MIGRLNHVAIAVKDIAAATRTYRETLGAEVSAPQDLPAPELAAWTVTANVLLNLDETVTRE